MNFPKSFLPIMFAALLPVSALAERPERTPAFPGAEGWGRYTTGGRGGKVYHVTTLKDGGPGSLRAAVEAKGPRTVVFDVSGTIHLNKDLDINNGDITIAGQTAPGDGIALADFQLSIGARNVIVRYIRVRPGNGKTTNFDGMDAVTSVDNRGVILDHCSLSWSTDECCSVYGNRFTTVQWCIISQSLNYAGHSKGAHGYGGMMGGEGASYHHNLIAHHQSRAPRLGERPDTGPRDTTDFRNNVMYNWAGLGCYGCENMNVNILNNYYKPGPGTRTRSEYIQKRICGVGVQEDPSNAMYKRWSTIYCTGNVNPNFSDVTRDNWRYGIWEQLDEKYRNNPEEWNLDEDKMKLTEPVKYYYVTTHSADEAYKRVLDYAGASLSRDALDEVMVSDTRSSKATYNGNRSSAKGIIDSHTDLRPDDAPDDWSPWPTLNSTEAPTDTDGDGIPDEWEKANGLNPEDAADGNLLNEEGYTMLEVYLASIVAHITEAQNEGGTADGYIETRPEIQDEYVISVETRQGTAMEFEGGITVTGGGYATKGNYIGYGRDQQHTVKLPEFAWVNAVKFEGTGRYNGEKYGDARLVELAGNTYEEGLYSLPQGDTPGEFTVELPVSVQQSMTMTWKGNNPWAVITLYTSEEPARAGIDAPTITAPTADDAWYNLQGIRMEKPTDAGLYIHNGRKVYILR